MAHKAVKIAIIGTGTAGMGAYREAIKHTESVALLEGDQYGTTCARVGCMPSKLLIAAAEARHNCGKFPAFGLSAVTPSVNGQKVMERVKFERDRFVGFVIEDVEEWNPEHRIQAYATFVDDHTLQLSNGDTLTAERIVLAVGSRPAVLDILKPAGERLITNDDVFYWDTLPKSVAVFGSGVIGLELGQALHRLGVRVHVFGRNQSIGPLSDPVVEAEAHKILSNEFPFHGSTKVISVKNTGDDQNGAVEITFQNGDAPVQTESFEYLLATSGRQSNLDKIGLENTSLQLNARGIPAYNPNTMQIGDSPIFVAGDATADLPILHEASDEGRLAGENAGLFPHVVQRARKVPLGITFTDPNIATVGKLYKQLKAEHIAFKTGAVSFANQGRSRVMLANKGLMHLYGCPKTGKLLGAEMVGPHHEHMAHLLAWVMQLNVPVADILQLPFYHPCIEEGLRTGLRNLLKEMTGVLQPPLKLLHS